MTNPSVHRARRYTLAGLTGLTGLLLLGACTADSGPVAQPEETAATGSVVVGSADFPEGRIAAEIYAGALKAEGIDASVEPNTGSREILYGAVEEGSVDILPDYSGRLLMFLDPSATARSAGDIAAALPDALEAKSPDTHLGVLDASGAEGRDAVVVTKVTAEKYGLESMAGLGEACGQLTLGAPGTFKERPDGLPGLREKYGCEPAEFKAIDGGTATLEALLTDGVQAAVLSTADPSIADNDLVVLEDPENNFPAQQVLPLVNLDTVHGDARAVLNEVSPQLTTGDLQNLNREVSGEEKRSPADAAADWLAEKGLAGG